VAITTSTNGSAKALKFKCPAVVYTKLDSVKNLLAKGASAIAVSTGAGQVLGTADAAGRQPLVASSPALDKPSCVQVASLDDIAQPPVAATKSAALDYSRYPVVATTYLPA
jgi:hypothetical protein